MYMVDMRSCIRTGCRWPAAATLAYRYATAEVWLMHLSDEEHPSTHDLCPHHADSLRVPRGWTMVDGREPREAVKEPSAAEVVERAQKLRQGVVRVLADTEEAPPPPSRARYEALLAQLPPPPDAENADPQPPAGHDHPAPQRNGHPAPQPGDDALDVLPHRRPVAHELGPVVMDLTTPPNGLLDDRRTAPTPRLAHAVVLPLPLRTADGQPVKP